MSQRSWIAEAMGVPESELLETFRRAADRPRDCNLISSAPCQEVQIRSDIDLTRLFPIPVHSEHDTGPYITAGLIIARNARTGIQNVSINRLQVHSNNRLGILMLPRHLHSFYKDAEEKGDALSVAIVIGVDPLTLLASQAILPINVDELRVSSALHKNPLEVVRCISSDIDVPAMSEIVIEGRLLPRERALEGPFGEFPKYYSARENREIIEVDAITHRRNPIFHTIIPAEMEHLLLGAIPREATILSFLQRSFPGVLDVRLAVGGVCRYHLYVKFKKKREGEPKNVIMGAFASHYDVKHVVVVDEDVNIHNATEVEWAIATRFQAERDLVVVHGAQGSPLDPSTTVADASVGLTDVTLERQGITSKLGFDATKPTAYEGHVFTRVKIPGEDTIDVTAYVSPMDLAAINATFKD
jgi:2,5-furandicarboxylate decarboxylase 1